MEPIDIREYEGPIVVVFHDGSKWDRQGQWEYSETGLIQLDGFGAVFRWGKKLWRYMVELPTEYSRDYEWEACTVTTPDGTPLVVKG